MHTFVIPYANTPAPVIITTTLSIRPLLLLTVTTNKFCYLIYYLFQQFTRTVSEAYGSPNTRKVNCKNEVGKF